MKGFSPIMYIAPTPGVPSGPPSSTEWTISVTVSPRFGGSGAPQACSNRATTTGSSADW